MTQAQCGNVVCKSNPDICNPGCVCCTWSNGNSRCMPTGSCPGAVTTTTTAPPPFCPAGTQCGSACTGSSQQFCSCNTTFDGGNPVCYLEENGCAGHGCSVNDDCTGDYGPESTCLLGFCTTPNLYCTTAAGCAAGYACVSLNGGCGGCDNYTGGTQGVCNPICTG